MTNAVHLPDTPDPAAAPAIRWGILGPGGIARRFASEVPQHTGSVIAAVGSRDLGRAEAFAKQYGIERAYGSYEQLVSDKSLDAIYVSTPHSEHRANASLALEAGLPVLVEKSFTANAAQAKAVFDLAQANNLFAMEAMWSRCLPHYAKLRQLVADGELGELLTALGVHQQSLDLGPGSRLANPALAGGALLDLGVYPLSVFHMLFGVPDQVTARGTLTDSGVDLNEIIVLRYGARMLATALNDMGAACRGTFALVGTKARVDIDDWFYTPSDLTLTPLGGEPVRLATKVAGGFQYEAAEAARQIKAGALESPLVRWQDTIEVMELMDEVRRQLGVSFPGE